MNWLHMWQKFLTLMANLLRRKKTDSARSKSIVVDKEFIYKGGRIARSDRNLFTKKHYNGVLVKARRKMAKESRRRNRSA